MKKAALAALLVATVTVSNIVLSAPGEREARWMILDHECQSSLGASYGALPSRDWRKQVDECQEARFRSENITGDKVDKAALERHCARVASGELKDPASPSRVWLNQCARMKAEFVETDEHAERLAEQLRREYEKRERAPEQMQTPRKLRAENTSVDERCDLIRVKINQKLGNGEYFGTVQYVHISGPTSPYTAPSILIYLPGHARPQSAGLQPATVGLRLGVRQVPLENGFNTDAVVYQVGDKKCAGMRETIGLPP